MLNNKTILITGGTGSFGKCFTRYVLTHYNPRKIIIYSRDEYKQFMMAGEFQEYADKLRFFIGDVRDRERLARAFEGVDYVIHAAALKQVPICEYNPNEAIKTNIHGAQNIIDAALDTHGRGVIYSSGYADAGQNIGTSENTGTSENIGVDKNPSLTPNFPTGSTYVKKVVALSTDKAVNPVNLYGGTKLVSDKLFIAANAYAGAKDINFSIVRYGNVAGSRGSIIPYFKKLIETGQTELPITDYRMTRFWISLAEGVKLVIKALEEATGGETFISKIPSFKITDLAEAMQPGCKTREIGIRPGEKLHEIMVTTEDSLTTYEYDNHFIVYPQVIWNEKQKINPTGKKVPEGFSYGSDNNSEWLSAEQIRELIKTIDFEK